MRRREFITLPNYAGVRRKDRDVPGERSLQFVVSQSDGQDGGRLAGAIW